MLEKMQIQPPINDFKDEQEEDEMVFNTKVILLKFFLINIFTPTPNY